MNNAITLYYLAYLEREDAEQRMNEASDDAIREILSLKPEGGRLPLSEQHAIELALVPRYNLKGKKGWQAKLWRAWAATLLRLQKQLSHAISEMREMGEAYADEHEDYQPELTAVLKVINLKETEKSSKKE